MKLYKVPAGTLGRVFLPKTFYREYKTTKDHIFGREDLVADPIILYNNKGKIPLRPDLTHDPVALSAALEALAAHGKYVFARKNSKGNYFFLVLSVDDIEYLG